MTKHKQPNKTDRKGISLKRLMRMFPDDTTARTWFEKQAWPQGPYCPRCGSFNVQCGIQHKSMTHRCRECPKRPMFSVKTGTVMQSSKLGYQTWAIAIHLAMTGLKGVSGMKLHRDLEITQKSAWHLTHRIRKAIEDGAAPMFAGPAKADEHYIAGKQKNMSNAKRAEPADTERGAVGKAAVAGVQHRETGRVAVQRTEAPDAGALQSFVCAPVEPGAPFRADTERDTQLMLFTTESSPFHEHEPAPLMTVLNGDCRTVLKAVEESSIQCCVTSPPYWGLRDYEHEAQIGSEDSPVEYVENLVNVFREVRRVLRPDGLVWLNIGDGYARNGGTGKHGPNAIVGNTRKLIQHRNCKVPPVWGLKALDLMGIPWRVAFALQEDGWFLRSHITWIKTAAMPESMKNRPTRSTEDIFLLSASPRYFYNSDGVRQESGANLRNCWTIGPDPNKSGHPAAFPRELARRCILLGSRPGDTVLDPFGGCGTTGIVAESLGRNSVLVELSRKWSDVIESRSNGA